MTVYPSPGKLTCDEGLGLLLVDAVSSRPLNTLDLIGAALYETKAPDDVLRSGSFNTGFPPSGSSVVVFQGLVAGTYRVSTLRLSNANYNETLELPASPSYEIQVEPGKVHYLGKIEARRSIGASHTAIEVRRDVEAEQAAWSKVLGKYSDSGCAPLIRRHLETLGAVAASLHAAR